MKMMKLFSWQLPYNRAVAWSLISLFLMTAHSVTNAQLTDSGVHAPPTTGTYGYNTFKPGAAGFPAAGGSYVDPVFGGTVRRLTNTLSTGTTQDDLYSRHWVNADGTLAMHHNVNGNQIVNTRTGAFVYTNQPLGAINFEVFWDAQDPDKYYYYNGASLMRRNLASQTNTIMKTFGATLKSLGGSVNFQSADGRYFVIRDGTSAHVWDSQTDTIFAGGIATASWVDTNGGWVGITPDGNYVVTEAGPSAQPQTEHYSYAINKSTKTVSTTPVQFWGLCGAHADLITASNGKSYHVGFNCYGGIPGIYRVDITLNQAGRTYQQQLADNQLLLPLTWEDDGHLSAVSTGPLKDWVFVSTESTVDNFNSGVSGWTAYKQEIVAVNVITLEVRRLAHHRSRSLAVDYPYQPRVTSSWDGSVVMWTSNFNTSSPTPYADLYLIQSPLGTITGNLPAPTNLRVIP